MSSLVFLVPSLLNYSEPTVCQRCFSTSSRHCRSQQRMANSYYHPPRSNNYLGLLPRMAIIISCSRHCHLTVFLLCLSLLLACCLFFPLLFLIDIYPQYLLFFASVTTPFLFFFTSFVSIISLHILFIIHFITMFLAMLLFFVAMTIATFFVIFRHPLHFRSSFPFSIAVIILFLTIHYLFSFILPLSFILSPIQFNVLLPFISHYCLSSSHVPLIFRAISSHNYDSFLSILYLYGCALLFLVYLLFRHHFSYCHYN